MDILGPEPEDEARPWTNCRYWRGAACDYGSEGWEFESLRARTAYKPRSRRSDPYHEVIVDIPTP
jgi:hypothetical protein